MSGLLQVEGVAKPETGPIAVPPGLEPVGEAVTRAHESFWKGQQQDGHWVFPLEADATITAEYVIYRRCMGLPVGERDRLAAERLLSTQRSDGGWSRFEGAPSHLSLAVEAYLALKLVGHGADEPALVKARDFILRSGGVEKSGVFTRIWLSYFGEFPERGIPAMPVEIVLLPESFPLSIYEMSSWARGTVVPLTVLQALRFRVPLEPTRGVRECWVSPPETADLSFDPGSSLLGWRPFFTYLDRALHALGRRHRVAPAARAGPARGGALDPRAAGSQRELGRHRAGHGELDAGAQGPVRRRRRWRAPRPRSHRGLHVPDARRPHAPALRLARVGHGAGGEGAARFGCAAR